MTNNNLILNEVRQNLHNTNRDDSDKHFFYLIVSNAHQTPILGIHSVQNQGHQ